MTNMKDNLEQLDKALALLTVNRARIPLEELETRYAVAYKKLTDEVRRLSEWYTDAAIEALAIPTNPKDAIGNDWLRKKVARIKEEEHLPGRLYDQIRESLIRTLDWNDLGNTIYKLLQRIEVEAWEPYHRRFVTLDFDNMADGRPYSSLLKAWWVPDPAMLGGGAWLDEAGRIRYVGCRPRETARRK